MNELCFAIEAENGVIDCSVFHGFPFTDTADIGVNVLCTTNGDSEAARGGAQRVAAWVWEHREQFKPETQTPETAVRLAREATEWPVVINDTADNPGGGSPGDSTHVLRAFLEGDLTGAVFGFICDPEVVEAATRAGVGETIDVKLGGKHDRIHGDPIPITGRVKCLTDGRVVLRAIMAGYEMRMGPTARLRVGGVDVIVSSMPNQTFDEELFLLHGVDVRRYKVVGLKGSNHFRAGFRDLAARIITADSPGLTTQRLDVFDRTNSPGPLWPLDPAAEYSPA
jgi:microcystin degradation protein MlrC